MSLFNNKQDSEETMFKAQQQMQKDQHGINTADRLDEQVFLRQQEENKDLVRWQQALQDEIEELKHDLKREEWDGEKWHPKQIFVGMNDEGKELFTPLPPLMNDAGIKMVEAEMRPLLSRNMINSNLDEKMVYGILRRTSDTIVNNIAVYGEEYRMEFGNYSHVTRLIKNFMIPTPFRALNDGERKHLRTMNKRVEAFSQSADEQPKKKRMFW